MPLSNWFHIANNYILSRNPAYLIFQITSLCNSRCLTCFNWRSIDEDKGKSDLTIEEIEKISANYGPLLQLTIGGGEPFLRDDIDDICRLFSKNNSVQHITIPTNALLPVQIASKVDSILKDCPLNYLRIGISLDAIGDKHDTIRGVSGNYDKVLKTYKMLLPLKKKYQNLGIEVSSVLSSLNADYMNETIDIVEKEFPEIDKHAVVVVRGDAREPDTKDVSAEKYLETVNYLYGKEKGKEKGKKIIPSFFKSVFKVNTEIVYRNIKGEKWPIPCLAGKKLIIIKPDGEVSPCEMLDEKLGNLRNTEYRMDRILKTERAEEILTKIKETKCSCSFECAVHASLIFNIKNYPRILSKMNKSDIVKE